MKNKGYLSTKIVLFRFGIIILTLLALNVLIALYKQLGEASQILNELAETGMIPIGNEKGSTNTPKGPIKRFLKVDPNLKERNFQTRFHENVFTYERRFYESDQAVTTSATKFLERNSRGRTSEKYQNTEDIEKTESINRTESIKNKGHKSNTDSIYNNDSSSSKDNNSNNNHINNSNSNSRRQVNGKSTKENKNTMKDQKKINSTKLVSRAKVMILAYRRSGSSFLGEMFNRNPRVFYLFEPIHPVEKIAGGGRYPLLYDTLVGHLLDVVYTCSFNKHPFLVNFLSTSPFRLKSETLSSGSCASNAIPQNISQQCQPLNQTMLESLCSSKDHTVVKTIRASNKKMFEFFSGPQTRGSHAYKVSLIHLVRDPRAIISSRLYLYTRRKMNNRALELKEDKNLTNALRRSVRVASANLCSRIHSDLRYGQRIGSNFYILLRYEDAAMHPVRTYGLISKFSGIKESAVVRDWLRRNTRVPVDTRDDIDDFSTSRNASASVNGWRRKLPFKLVTEVQDQCGEVMEALGYLPAKSEHQLMDMQKSLADFQHWQRLLQS